MPRLWPVVLAPPGTALYILIAPSVRDRVESFLHSDAGLLEAGGILLGFRRDPHLEVLDATLPSEHDVRRRYQFIRRSRSHQLQATKAWRESGRTMDYLGEWHTHPESHPRPSTIDRSELLRRSIEHRRESLVELIIGTQALWSGMVVAGRYVPLITINAQSATSTHGQL